MQFDEVLTCGEPVVERWSAPATLPATLPLTLPATPPATSKCDPRYMAAVHVGSDFFICGVWRRKLDERRLAQVAMNRDGGGIHRL